MQGFSCQAVVIGGRVLVCWQPPVLPGGSISCGGGKVRCTCFNCLPQNFTMSGPHYNSVPKRRVIGHAATEFLSPDDVAEFFTAILDAGLGLGTLLTSEYPRAELVSEALYVVTKVVGVYGLEGKWVTSWDRGAQSEIWQPLRSKR